MKGSVALDLYRYRRLLLQKKAKVRNGIGSIMEKSFSEGQKVNIGEFSSYDQHPGEMALETFEREKDLGLKDGLEIDRHKIDLALERLSKGTYGFCLRCKKPIPQGRLEAMPEAELCVECQKFQEGPPKNVRPVEEQSLEEQMHGIQMMEEIETMTDDPYAVGRKKKRPEK